MDWNNLVKGRHFLTDRGEETRVETPDGDMVLGRFAVWAPIPNTDRHQVVEVGSDGDALADKYAIPADLRMRLMNPAEAVRHGGP